MFGARFYDQFGSEPSEAWVEAVTEVRGDQIKSALTKIRNSGAQYPPSLPEFLALARAQRFPQAANEPTTHLDHFDRFGNIQFFKFLRLYDTTPAQLPTLLERKREIIDAARNDPEMQLGGDAAAQGAELGEILFSAWRKVIGATEVPRKGADGFVRVGAL